MSAKKIDDEKCIQGLKAFMAGYGSTVDGKTFTPVNQFDINMYELGIKSFKDVETFGIRNPLFEFRDALKDVCFNNDNVTIPNGYLSKAKLEQIEKMSGE